MKDGSLGEGPPRVLMFTPTAHGGHARYTNEVLNALVDVGGSRFKYDLLTRKDISSIYKSEKYTVSNTIEPLKERRKFQNKMTWAFSRVVHYLLQEYDLYKKVRGDRKIKIVHLQELSVYFGWISIFLIRSLFRRNVKIVMTVHNVIPHAYPQFIPKICVNKLSEFLYRRLDEVFVHSVSLRNEFLRRFNMPEEKVTAIPHGVWTVKVSKTCDQTEKDGVILFYGNIRKNKGLHNVLKALPFARNVKKLIIAGNVSDQAYFEEVIIPLIKEVRDEGCSVELIARYISEEEVFEIFSRTQILVLLYENFFAQSGILFDAISFEKPVVASGEGALGDAVAELKIGKVVISTDSQLVAAVIDQILQDTRAKTFDGAFELARKKYSWSNQAEILLSAYTRYTEYEKTTLGRS